MHSSQLSVIRSVAVMTAVAGFACSVLAGNASQQTIGQRQQAQIQTMQTRFPWMQVQSDAGGSGRLKTIYGVPMHSGVTAQAAVDAFLATDVDVFGVPDLELWQDHAWDLSGGDFTVFRFHQTIDGIPVENALGRILVRNFAAGTPGRQPAHVVMATGVFATRPEGGFAADTVTADQAQASLRQMEGLPIWSQPEMVIFFGEGEFGTAKRAWKVQGYAPAIGQPVRKTYYVDAATGDVIHVRNDIHNVDVTGTAQGYASPGTKPDITGNSPVLLNLPKLNISITGGSSAYTNSSGAFSITNAGSTPVTLTTNVSSGRWVNVNPTSGAEPSASVSATPGTPASVVLNPTPSALLTAQVNTLIHTTLVHDYYRDRLGAGPIPGIDVQIPAYTGVSGTCNAYFDPAAQTINFFNAGGGCSNTAYSTVIVHEYGHFIVDRLGLGQGGFGEGFGDSNAVLMYDVGIVGENFQGTSPVRDIDGANQQYPCSSEIHTCGQMIAGVWRDIRLNLGTSLGSVAGLNLARNLHVAWAPVTAGGEGASYNNSANPTTAIEILTLDDNDGDLTNCTPNYAAIAAAFTKHGVTVPKPTLTASFVGGVPTTLTPNVAKVVMVNSPTSAGQALALVYRVNGGSFNTVPMTEGPSGTFAGTLPATACPGKVDYYIQRTGGASCIALLPATAPTSFYTATAASGTATPFSDNFQTNKGWTVSNTAGLTAGAWQRGVPANGGRGDPVADFDGSGQCYLTQNVAGDSDVDGGGTYLISPTFDATGADAYISYARWYSNNFGGAPETDTFVVEISGNNGSTWTNLETVGPSGVEVRGGWFYKTFRIADKIAPTSTMKVRFLAQDLGTGSVVEAAVDAVSIDVLSCAAPCAADFNNDGFADFTDFDAYVTAFEAGDGSADVNNDGFLDFTDFDAFVAIFEAGC